MTKRKILMIDDDEMMRILFRDIFWIHRTADREYDIAPVESLEKARELLFGPEPMKPDIIFCDLRLPVRERDGSTSLDIQPSLDFMKELRAKSEFARVPIIAFSSFSEEKIKEKARQAGADHYLVKGEYMPRELIEFANSLDTATPPAASPPPAAGSPAPAAPTAPSSVPAFAPPPSAAPIP